MLRSRSSEARVFGREEDGDAQGLADAGERSFVGGGEAVAAVLAQVPRGAQASWRRRPRERRPAAGRRTRAQRARTVRPSWSQMAARANPATPMAAVTSDRARGGIVPARRPAARRWECRRRVSASRPPRPAATNSRAHVPTVKPRVAMAADGRAVGDGGGGDGDARRRGRSAAGGRAGDSAPPARRAFLRRVSRGRARRGRESRRSASRRAG